MRPSKPLLIKATQTLHRHFSVEAPLPGVLKLPKASILGLFEDLNAPVEEIEATLKYPVKVVGSRKPNKFHFFSWDPNCAFIRDRQNPNLFLTFQDAAGRVVGPVCYRGDILSWGPKLEASFRDSWGFIDGWKGLEFPEIPKTLPVCGGYDAGLGLLGGSKLILPNGLPPIRYFGFSLVLGMTKISPTGCQFQRLPYLWISSWGLRQWIAIVTFNIVIFLFLLGIGVVIHFRAAPGPDDLSIESLE